MMFAENATRLAGMAGLMFGWAPAVFWEATPAEMGALVRALRRDDAAPMNAGDAARLMEAFPDGRRD